MYAHRRTSKILAIFLLAFVCLNAGGAACLAYCETFEAAEADHCPLTRKADHCNGAVNAPENIDALDRLVLDCCRLPLSMISAPLVSADLKERTVHSERIVATERPAFLVTQLFRTASDLHYRPPPIDGPRLCIRNCALLI